jgi:REP element-mobilizing transposase RayT
MSSEERPVRKRLYHDVPPWVEDGALFFITVSCRERGRDWLTMPDVSAGLLESARFYHEKGKWHLNLFLLMPDHWHAILAFPRHMAMTDALRDWKRYTARRFKLDWQDGFFEHRLRDGYEADAKHDYIRQNPVRQRLCQRAEDWPHQARGTQEGCVIGAW